jgi:hypothetical protein
MIYMMQFWFGKYHVTSGLNISRALLMTSFKAGYAITVNDNT